MAEQNTKRLSDLYFYFPVFLTFHLFIVRIIIITIILSFIFLSTKILGLFSLIHAVAMTTIEMPRLT